MPEMHDFVDDRRGPRLQKVLAEAGVGSRRTCETLIESGVVRVNGQVVKSLPAWVDPVRDRITVEGRRIRPGGHAIYIMLHKPRGVVCTSRDPEGRRRAIDLVNHPLDSRLYCVGRLDMESSGLLVLTNDGELANRLTHPRYEMHKIYEVMVRGSLDENAVARLQRGLFLPDRRAGMGSRTTQSRLSIIKRDRDRTLLRMELREGRNRQIRRMMLKVGHPVKRLRRVQMGPLKLAGLSAGQWRDLTSAELSALHKAAFAQKISGARMQKSENKQLSKQH